MKNLTKIIFLIILVIFPISSQAFWANVHERIADETIERGKESFNIKVKRQTGLENALSIFARSSLLNKSLKNWTLYGSSKEDDTPRYLNHFYNPLDGAGLNDIFAGHSSYVWANEINSVWSWKNGRHNFYLGLTAPSDAERRSSLADSFRALGQVMHLVQDLGVPAHVRNDAHPFGDGFEAYTSKNVDSLNFTPIPFAGPKQSLRSYSPWQLWDSDQYDGTNPSTSTNLGLAEYTNANFASEDTIFTENNLTDWNPLNNKHYSPFPRREDTVLFAESQNTTWNGFEVYRKYFEKVGGGQPIKHFATASRLYAYLLDDPDPSLQGLDDRCHRDYADLLIPRAVGYSAALIDYFFRGQIDMVPDPGNASQYVIKNESDEDMSGTFSLYYDDANGIRKPVPGTEGVNLSIVAKGASSPVTFTAPNDAKEAGKYVLVFNGAHGAEVGAVTGKMVTLIKDNIIRISLYGPDGSQIKRDILFKAWGKRKDTGSISSISGITWKYNDDQSYWEVTVPSISDTVEYRSSYNQWHKVTPAGGFNLEEGVYLDYLWKAAAVGISASTYTGTGQIGYGIEYQEEETRNFAQNLGSLWFKTGFKTNTQPIPGIEVLLVYPKSNYGVKLVYEAKSKKIYLDGGSGVVIGTNDAGVYGLSQRGYSAIVIKVTPSALPGTNHTANFWLNSGLLDKSKQIKTGSPWTQYPGNHKATERYNLASLVHVGASGILKDTIPNVYSEQSGVFSGINDNPILVSSTMDYSMSALVTQQPYAYYVDSSDSSNRLILTSDMEIDGLGLFITHGYDFWEGPLGTSMDNHIITETSNDGVTMEFIEGPTIWSNWRPEFTIDLEGVKVYNDFSITLNGYTHSGTSSFSKIFSPGSQNFQAITHFGAPLNLTVTNQVWDYHYDNKYWKLIFMRNNVISLTATDYSFKAIASGPEISLK